jgi:hypothetical protein
VAERDLGWSRGEMRRSGVFCVRDLIGPVPDVWRRRFSCWVGGWGEGSRERALLWAAEGFGVVHWRPLLSVSIIAFGAIAVVGIFLALPLLKSFSFVVYFVLGQTDSCAVGVFGFLSGLALSF